MPHLVAKITPSAPVFWRAFTEGCKTWAFLSVPAEPLWAALASLVPSWRQTSPSPHPTHLWSCLPRTPTRRPPHLAGAPRLHTPGVGAFNCVQLSFLTQHNRAQWEDKGHALWGPPGSLGVCSAENKQCQGWPAWQPPCPLQTLVQEFLEVTSRRMQTRGASCSAALLCPASARRI